jgi:hypothetical protein
MRAAAHLAFHFILAWGTVLGSTSLQAAPEEPILIEGTNAPSAVNPAPAPVDPFADPLVRQVQDLHQQVVDGKAKALDKLVPWLEQLVKDHPDNHLLQAYLGSAYTLASRDSFPGPGKLKYLKQGGATLDAAVDAAPREVGPRFIRAVNYFSLPTVFGKRDTARDDFQLLLREVRSPLSKETFSVETRQAICWFAGLSYRQVKQPDDARDAWQAGIALDPKSDLGQKMADALAKLKG